MSQLELSRVWKQVPLTIVVSGAALVAACFPALSQRMSYDLTAIQNGQVWRMATGHVTHWSANHLFWDLAMFAGLCLVCEARTPHVTRWLVLVSSVGISTGLMLLEPTLLTYRGLSGIDTALFGFLIANWIIESWQEQHRTRVALGALLLGCLCGKIGWENWTGTTLFADSSAGDYVPVALAHVLGALVGLAFAAWQLVSPSAASCTLDARTVRCVKSVAVDATHVRAN